MPGAIGHQRGIFLVKPCSQALHTGARVALEIERSQGWKEKSKQTQMSFFFLMTTPWFMLFFCNIFIKQQCLKPTDLQVILKKGKIILLLFAVGLVGKCFLGTHSSGGSLSQLLPCRSLKWYMIIFKLGKMTQPWLTGRITPKSLCFCSFSYSLLFYPCVFPQVEVSRAAYSPLLVVCGQQRGTRRLWMRVWRRNHGCATHEQAMGQLRCTLQQKFARVTVVSVASSALA